jgi:hypothetical protein
MKSKVVAWRSSILYRRTGESSLWNSALVFTGNFLVVSGVSKAVFDVKKKRRLESEGPLV